MNSINYFKDNIFRITKDTFASFVFEVYSYQYRECSVFRNFNHILNKNPKNVRCIKDIPFLPIEFFKKHTIKSSTWKSMKIFKSSGTTGQNRSYHHIQDVDFYLQNTKKIFEKNIGRIKDFKILALLPTYLENGESSLVAMVDYFIQQGLYGSGYLNFKESEKLINMDEPTILFSTPNAILSLAKQNRYHCPNLIVIETGGMKGASPEITREELYEIIRESLGTSKVFSEYGMTEILSQAYGMEGNFRFPPWADVLIREINDPFAYVKDGKIGGINLIDLTNIHSCCFIETKDIGIINKEYFKILGRFDNSDIRGCNLLT